MALNREEIAADLVWRYVEHLRQSRGEDPSVALSPAELTRLVETMTLAGDLTYALAPEATAEARKAAVLRRVEAAVAVPAPAISTAADRPAAPRPWFAVLTGGAPVAAWKFRAALGAALALAIAFSTALPIMRARTPTETVVKRIRVPVEASEIDIQPVEEALVHDLLPRMVRNELPPKQERNLMWHMLVCRGCFDEYVELKHHRTVGEHPKTTFTAYRP